MAGNARADERDHLEGRPAGGGPQDGASAAPGAATAPPEPRATAPAPLDGHDRAAPRGDRAAASAHDHDARASAHDDDARASAHDDDARASAHDIQRRASPEVAHRRTAAHEAQGGAEGAEEAPELGRNPEVEESALPPHEPGSMDISVHEATYQRFIGITIRAVIAIFAVLILLALLNA